MYVCSSPSVAAARSLAADRARHAAAAPGSPRVLFSKNDLYHI